MATQLICGACRASKKRNVCPGCCFTEFFPLESYKRFAILLETYGIANLTKVLDHVPHEQLNVFFQDLYLEAAYRTRNKVGGWPRLMRNVIREKDSTIAYLLWLLRGSPAPHRVPPMAVIPAFLQQQQLNQPMQGGDFNPAGLGLEHIPLQMPNQAAGIPDILLNLEQQMQLYQEPGMPWIFPQAQPQAQPQAGGNFHFGGPNPGGNFQFGGPNPRGPNPGGNFQFGGPNPGGPNPGQQPGGFHPHFGAPNPQPRAFNNQQGAAHLGGPYPAQAQQGGQFPGPNPGGHGHGHGYGG